MYIEINDNTILRHIRQKIADYYPYLQIKFSDKLYKKYETSLAEDIIYPGQTIGEVKQSRVSAVMEITPVPTVAGIEKGFQERFGLPVQILL